MIRGIGLRGAVAVNVITMIGIGPLITIPLVLATLHGSTALIAWVAGAIIALCDGLAWAELGSLYPGSGGTYVFLREAFGRNAWGRMLAFLFAWQIVLSAPLVLASGYIGFAHYAAYLYPPLASDARAQGIVAAALAIVTLGVLYRPIRTINAIGIALAGVAVATLAAVIASAATHFSPAQAFSADAHPGFFAALAAGLGPALIITLYDYYGYGQSCTLGDEVRDTKRVLPRSVILSIAVVAILYVALQVGVLGVVHWRELVPATGGGTIPDAANYVASIVVERTLGTWPARIVTVAILITAFASTFGNLLGYSRIPFSAARDGVFLKPFARLDARGRFPNVSLAAIGLLAIPACFLSLGDVINALTTGLVIIQSLAQLGAIVALRLRKIRAPYRMTLFPLPLLIAAAGWVYIFFSAGAKAIAFGIVSLLAGIAMYLVRSKLARDWPFKAAAAAAAFAACAVSLHATAGAAAADELASGAVSWSHAVIADRTVGPVFEVDGKPFFVYGAAFFYERIPREQWDVSMQRLRALGINTLDLYVPWNWHELSDGDFDFNGRTSPRRDLDRVLLLARQNGFKILLRPGPVIRNEWRNGGYPAWLLSRPEYGMPEHDILEGRYPATATLQNQHSDDAAAQWMTNATHMTYAKRWLERVLTECVPYADLVLAVALDDDQGAYIDNQTYPAPHLRSYLEWLRDAVHGITGPREPVFINTYQMKVTASSPVWAMGNWYQSEAYSIGEHDRSELEFSMGLLHTRPGQPMMASEFQAGWLEQPDDIRPRPADATNTSLALATMFGLGLRGVVNFPAQDTLYPGGWEAPFANSFYAWDAAFGVDGMLAQRATGTARFGALVTAFGPDLAAARPDVDAAILYLGASLRPGETTNERYAQIADATIAAQRSCRNDGISCVLADPAAVNDTVLKQYPIVFVPALPDGSRALDPRLSRRLAALKRIGARVLPSDAGRDAVFDALRSQGHKIAVTGIPGGSFARVLAGNVDGFLSVPNYGTAPLRVARGTVLVGKTRRTLPPFTIPAHDALVVPIGVHLDRMVKGFGPGDSIDFLDCMPIEYVLDPPGTVPHEPSLGFTRSTLDHVNGSFRSFPPNPPQHCSLYAHLRGKLIVERVIAPNAIVQPTGIEESHGDPGPPEPAKPPVLPIRDDADFGTFDGMPRAPFATTTGIAAYTADVFADGEPDAVLDNGLVRLVVSPNAGARAFVFQDDASGRNCFTTVGAMRDDIAIEPPLSTTDKIAKYTHQFPSGTFNRTYGAELSTAATHASATFSYDAPDVVPRGARFARTVTLPAHERAFYVDETAGFYDIVPSDPQRAVSVTSLAVGSSTNGSQTFVLSPEPAPFSALSTVHVSGGNALGYYDAGGSQDFATIAWRTGDVEDAAILERDHSIVVRLTLARGRTAHLRFGFDAAPTVDRARALLAAAGAAVAR